MCQLLPAFSACATHPDKDDRGCLGHEAIELEQSRKLVLVLVDVNVELLDALDGQLLVRKRQNVGVGRESVRIVDDGFGEGGRKKNSLDVLR